MKYYKQSMFNIKSNDKEDFDGIYSDLDITLENLSDGIYSLLDWENREILKKKLKRFYREKANTEYWQLSDALY